MKKQPAKINYFFKDGYIEFGNTIKNTFLQCGKVIKKSAEKVSDSFSDIIYYSKAVFSFSDGIFSNIFHAIGPTLVFGIFLGRLILSILLTPILCLIILTVQAIILLIFMIIFYILYVFVAFIDWLYRKIKKISTSCPNCQNRYDLPSFVCTCGVTHTRLTPSKYGVLQRKCICDRKLKTAFFNGRHKQAGKWICPDCGYELGASVHVDIPIPVVGGPSSGKTCYISMAISQIEKKATSYKLNFAYKANNVLGDDYENNKQTLLNGRLPMKTNDKRMKYYQFYLTPRRQKVKNLISICDVAGEAYENNNEISKQIGYKYANAFLMIVDPLSIRKYREEMANKIDITSYKASNLGMDEVLDTLIKTLENINCLNSRNMIKTDVAVVFTKCDIPGLEEKIGSKAVKSYMQTNNIKSKFDATNKVCEAFLTDYEEENFLNSLKSKFKSIQFFTCSALGHIEDGTNFVPEGVEEPALWLIDKASASINLKEKWGKKI